MSNSFYTTGFIGVFEVIAGLVSLGVGIAFLMLRSSAKSVALSRPVQIAVHCVAVGVPFVLGGFGWGIAQHRGHEIIAHLKAPTLEDFAYVDREALASVQVREWRTQEDWDFVGVDISASPDVLGILVVSRFGSAAGLQRVVDWIERGLKSEFHLD